jgi:hypothetical protein
MTAPDAPRPPAERADIRQLQETIMLLNSMVRGGESHSDESRAMVRAALLLPAIRPAPPAEGADLSASWFPEWNIEHLGLTCQRCVTWGGPACCAAIEGQRRGLASTHPITTAERAALDVLERIQWIESDEGEMCCPECWNWQGHGHRPECELAAALARRAGAAAAAPADDADVRMALHYAISAMSAIHSQEAVMGTEWNAHLEHLRGVLHAANAARPTTPRDHADG